MVVSKDLARQLDDNPFWNKCIDSCSLLSTGIIDSLKKEKINNYYAKIYWLKILCAFLVENINYKNYSILR